jgi:adenylate cyclase
MRRRRSLRVTLLTILLSLTVLTVTLVGASGYFNLNRTANEMSRQILTQTSHRVDHRADDLIYSVMRLGDLNDHLFQAGLLTTDDFPRLVRYWRRALEVHPSISNIYITLPDSGHTLIVAREPNTRQLFVQELRPVPGGFGLFNFNFDNYLGRLEQARAAVAQVTGQAATPLVGPLAAAISLSNQGERFHPVKVEAALDQRRWPWYQRAVKAHRGVWSDTYLFFDPQGKLSYPGVTYASPLYRNGKLTGVLAVDLDVFTLCDFLRQMKVTENGYAFIVERQRHGGLRLVAHRDRNLLQSEGVGSVQGRRMDLSANDKDPVVAAFLKQIPDNVDPAKLDHLVPVRFKHDGVTYRGSYRGLEEGSLPTPRWLLCIVLPEDDLLQDARRHLWMGLAVAVVVLVLAIVLSFLTAAQVARPLESLAQETEAIGRLELIPREIGHSLIVEVDRLADATEDMKTSLRSFRKYVPTDLVRQVIQSGQEAVLGGERRQLTVYFSDIANFTGISEGMDPEALVVHLGEYLQALSEQVLASGGTVDKYIGDAIMAFWGAPLPLAGHALAACTAAMHNQQVLRELRSKWQAEGKPPFHARIGINTGEVVVGNIGSEARMNYTVIGDAVNLASRLEGLNKYYGTSILVSESTFEEAKGGIVARPIDWVSVKGKSAAVLVYELLALREEAKPSIEAFAELYRKALDAYRGQRWEEATGLFEETLTQRPDDGPATEMLRRIRAYRENPPGDGWDGVHHMESK